MGPATFCHLQCPILVPQSYVNYMRHNKKYNSKSRNSIWNILPETCDSLSKEEKRYCRIAPCQHSRHQSRLSHPWTSSYQEQASWQPVIPSTHIRINLVTKNPDPNWQEGFLPKLWMEYLFTVHKMLKPSFSSPAQPQHTDFKDFTGSLGSLSW